MSLRIAFVVPWYGEKIGGGAESLTRSLIKGIQTHISKVRVEVITTCIKEFASDWNINEYIPGVVDDHGVSVRRFKADKVTRDAFGAMNQFRLMPSITADLDDVDQISSPLTPNEEQQYLSCMVTSRTMIKYLKKNKNKYDYFIILPYMFGTTVQATACLGKKSVLIPCLHNERYAYMEIYRRMMNSAGALLFNVKSEQKLAQKIAGLKSVDQLVLGVIVDNPGLIGDEQRFRNKYSVNNPFVLYAGRQIAGKNLPLLVEYFRLEKKKGALPKDLDLILIGGGDLDYSGLESERIFQLGHVSKQDKIDAMSSSLCLCQPSLNESFSIVIMESWLQKRPVIVSSKCDVTRDHCEDSGGGLDFNSSKEFSDHIRTLLHNPLEAKSMAELGYQYVVNNFSEENIIRNLESLLRRKKEIDTQNHLIPNFKSIKIRFKNAMGQWI